MTTFHVRKATPDDAAAVAAVLAMAHHARPEAFAGEPPDAPGFLRMTQTGHEFHVAEAGGRVAAVARAWDEEGIAYLDHLGSVVPGAGHALLRGLERRSQDRGLRLIRMDAPDVGRLMDVLLRWGYFPISRRKEGRAGRTVDVVGFEKRLPLLTVREQRREDAGAIATLTGQDTWLLEQQIVGGWFVLADGERVCGVARVQDAGGGEAHVAEPVLLDDYRGRGLELWMLERAAYYAETNGFHTVSTAATPALDALERDLEDRRWFLEGAGGDRRYVKRLGDAPPAEGMGDPDW